MGKLSQSFYEYQHASRGMKRVSGTFTTNNVSDPVASSSVGAGFVVTRSGVGRFLVTLSSAARAVLHVDANIMGVANRIPSFPVAPSPGTARVGASFTIEVQSAIGTAAESTGVVVTFCAEVQMVRNHRGNA